MDYDQLVDAVLFERNLDGIQSSLLHPLPAQGVYTARDVARNILGSGRYPGFIAVALRDFDGDHARNERELTMFHRPWSQGVHHED